MNKYKQEENTVPLILDVNKELQCHKKRQLMKKNKIEIRKNNTKLQKTNKDKENEKHIPSNFTSNEECNQYIYIYFF